MEQRTRQFWLEAIEGSSEKVNKIEKNRSKQQWLQIFYNYKIVKEFTDLNDEKL